MLFFADWTSWNFLFATMEITNIEKNEIIVDVQILYQRKKHTKGETMSIKYTEVQIEKKKNKVYPLAVVLKTYYIVYWGVWTFEEE